MSSQGTIAAAPDTDETEIPVPGPEPTGKRQRPKASLAVRIWLIVLALLVVAALGALAYVVLQLVEAQELIDEQQEEIADLNEIVDTKEQFGAAMQQLMDTAREFEGAPMADLVPFDDYERLAQQAWSSRRSVRISDIHIGEAIRHTRSLQDTLERAAQQRSTNATHTLAEDILDSYGAGFVTLAYDDVDKLCEQDVLGCVLDTDPYVVHLDRNDLRHPSVDKWGERHITLHEFAHVLQFTNPVATESAGKAFGDDWEFMADCYALHTTGDWSLDRRVWINSYSYWDVQYGYGRVCDAGQRKVIDDWLDRIGVVHRPISQ